MTAPAIEAREVSRCFGDTNVITGASLAIGPGEWVSLVGPSGCGKTTLVQMLGLIDRPTSGQIVVGERDGWAASASWRARTRLHRIGMVFQDGNLLGQLTARENVALPAWRHGGSRRAAFARADELLARLDLASRAAVGARALSTGEAQRVAIARALVNHPAVVLADEPTGSLDSAAAGTVLEALAEVVRGGTALLVVTHDREVARRAARIVEMRDGRLTDHAVA